MGGWGERGKMLDFVSILWITKPTVVPPNSYLRSRLVPLRLCLHRTQDLLEDLGVTVEPEESRHESNTLYGLVYTNPVTIKPIK